MLISAKQQSTEIQKLKHIFLGQAVPHSKP